MEAITILGSSGGAARAVLALLQAAAADKSDPLQPFLQQAALHVVDMKQKPLSYYEQLCPQWAGRLAVHELDVHNLAQFRQHLRDSGTRVVVDVSWADTGEMLACCDELGVLYVNSALENREVDEDSSLYGFPLTERYRRFQEIKGQFTNTTAVIGSGMNPGVVQWMLLHMLRQSKEQPRAAYIVEHDTSRFLDEKLMEPQTLYVSWSVECFLDEAILSYPMFVRHHRPHYFYEDVYAAEYKVTLGNKEFYGCLMPHEEVLSLGEVYEMEMGFLYRVNEHTTELIRSQLGHTDVLWDYPQQLLAPAVGTVTGTDLVGVLVVYEDHEVYMYNVLGSEEIFARYGTNATYWQVACGIYAGLATLLLDALPPGVRCVDEWLLGTNSRYGEYVQRHMTEFVFGRNQTSGGLLHERVRRTPKGKS